MTLLLSAFTSAPTINKVYNCDALTLLRAMPSGSVDCCVTSPPYDSLRVYNGYTFDFQPIAHEIYRVLKPGGVCVWVIGDQISNHQRSMTSMRQALYFTDVVGFWMYDLIIFHDPGTAFQHPGRYVNQHEFMYVLSKDEPKTKNIQVKPNKWAGEKRPAGSTKVQYSADGSKRETRPRLETKDFGVMGNVWTMGAGYGKSTMDRVAFNHPATFPEQLAELHIKSWTNPGDLVLDCFMGSGTTAKIARNLKRDYIGSEISFEYMKIIHDRLRMPFEEKQVKRESVVSDLPLWAPVPRASLS